MLDTQQCQSISHSPVLSIAVAMEVIIDVPQLVVTSYCMKSDLLHHHGSDNLIMLPSLTIKRYLTLPLVFSQ